MEVSIEAVSLIFQVEGEEGDFTDSLMNNRLGACLAPKLACVPWHPTVRPPVVGAGKGLMAQGSLVSPDTG